MSEINKVNPDNDNDEIKLDADDLDNPSFHPETMEILQEKTKNREQIDFNQNRFYKTKICGYDVNKIGNTYAFCFDDNYQPKYIIGPHWYFYIVMNVMILALSIFIYHQFLGRVLNSPLKLLYILCILFLICVYFYNFIKNPGIVSKHIIQKDSSQYCQICQCYIEAKSYTHHCKFCNVCINGFDHHCVWIGKCVGKENKFIFFFLLVSVGIIYAFILATSIYYIIKIVKE